MQILHLGRRTGKTTALVHRMMAEPGLVVVGAHWHNIHDEIERMWGRQTIPEELREALKRRVYGPYPERLRGLDSQTTRVAIDDLGTTLHYLLGYPVVLATDSDLQIRTDPPRFYIDRVTP